MCDSSTLSAERMATQQGGFLYVARVPPTTGRPLTTAERVVRYLIFFVVLHRRKAPTDETLQCLRDGVQLKDGMAAASTVQLISIEVIVVVYITYILEEALYYCAW